MKRVFMSLRSDEVTPVATGVTEERLGGLRTGNIGLTLLHLAQAVGAHRVSNPHRPR
jgi:hypothetical protein